mmetsp:Transcript_21733/g.51572  ORF Transcript_21733/g.51572 Transcript_21733/m.51572 type:complete len:232 (-) Transcript_21733:112-807(-)
MLVEGLDAAEVAQARRDRAVLLDLQREVQERLVSAGDGFAVEAPRLIRQRALENVLHPRALLRERPVEVSEGVVAGRVDFPVELLADLVEDVVHELVRVLVLVAPERLVVLLQHRDELFRSVDAKLFLVAVNRCERLRQRQQHRIFIFVVMRIPCPLKHRLAKGNTEIESLQDRIAVACVAKVLKTKETFAFREGGGERFLQLRAGRSHCAASAHGCLEEQLLQWTEAHRL